MKKQTDSFKIMTDSELVIEFKKGNEAAFNALYLKYERQVYAFIFSKCKDKYVSEEVTQITFMKVVSSINSYSEKGLFRAWLFRIASNELVNAIRKNSGTICSLEDKKIRISKSEFFEDSDFVEKTIEQKENNDRLRSFIQKLPPNQSLVISLLLEEMKYKEVAIFINMNENTVKTTRFHAVENLRKMYFVEN